MFENWLDAAARCSVQRGLAAKKSKVFQNLQRRATLYRSLHKEIAPGRRWCGMLRILRDVCAERVTIHRSPPHPLAIGCRLHKTSKFLRKLFPCKKYS